MKEILKGITIFGDSLIFYRLMIIDHKTFDLHGKMVFEKAIIKAPFSKPNPMPDEACFLYVRKGLGVTYSENDFSEISENECILMKCGSYLNKMLSDRSDGIYEAIAVHFYPETLQQVYQGDLPEFLKNSSGKLPDKPAAKIENDDLFQKFFDGIFFYFSNPELVNEELVILKLKELLLLLENTKESDKLHHILSALFSQKSYSFRSIVQAHLFEALSIQELAAISGQSLSGFKRKFAEVFEKSPAKYIREQRLKKAAELLTARDGRSISDIAYECAFSDVASFSNCFKKQFKQTPSQYRDGIMG